MTLPNSDDDQAAFDAFTTSVPRETMADRRERSEAGANRIKQALWGIQIYSLCAGLGAAAAFAVYHPTPLWFIPFVVVGAIISAVLGSVACILFVLVSYLRHGGWRSEERVNLVPSVWLYGPLGAIGGSMAGALASAAACGAVMAQWAVGQIIEKGKPTSVVPILLGGLVGAIICAVVRFIRRRAQAERKSAADHVFWP